MVTISKTGGTFFIAGSSTEGAAYARHLAQQPMQDFDFMLVEGTITSEECLIKLKDAEGFVQVKHDETYTQPFLKTSFSSKRNQNGILCIDGFKMKEKYCGTESISFLPTVTLTTTGQTAINSASAEVKFKGSSTTMSLGEQFENTLDSVRRMKAEGNVSVLQERYKQVCNTYEKSLSQFVLPMLHTIADAEGLNLQTFHDTISFTFPLFNIHMPQVNQVRLHALLDFYEKYKHLGNPAMLEDYIKYGELLLDNEADFVPALLLEFWPHDVQLFLDRIHLHRPILHQLIMETTSMHLIPKWSTKTPEIDQELEFRYSFSAVELLLAMNRTRVEQILNGVARSIYYRYLKKQPSLNDHAKTIIPSYFIKTTVLWMCEMRNYNDQFTDADDDQTIARIMAKEWLEYVKQMLSNGVCKHYFIDGINLLESCSPESLAKAIDILSHDVNLDEDVPIEIFSKQNELLHQQRQTTEDWIGNLKVENILEAINEYRLLKENWLCPSESAQDEGDATGCLYVLNQLRTLDGNNQQNWTTYKRFLLGVGETTWAVPMWGEEVEFCSICDFADELLGLGTMLNNIKTAMENADVDGSINTDIGQYEMAGIMNILNDFIAPANTVRNGLMTSWLPMFTCSYFDSLPAHVSSAALSSFKHRSVITDHPVGPLNNLLKGSSLPATLDSSTRQAFHQHSGNVSNTFLNLLNECPDRSMTLNDLIKYYDKPPPTTEVNPISSGLFYAANPSSLNKEEFILIVFDPNLNIECLDKGMFRNINDYVVFHVDQSEFLNYVQSLNEENILLAIFHPSLDFQFFSRLQNLNQINSIFICSTRQHDYLCLMNKYTKIVDILTEETVLLEQIRLTIEQQLRLTFAFHDPRQVFTSHTRLSKENALFLWNLSLKDLLMKNDSTDKYLMVQKCREYYHANPTELENIKQFERTYEPENAYEWYRKRDFIFKQLHRAFRTIDIEQLKLFSFFIRDLSATIKSTSSMNKAYHTTILSTGQFEMLRKNIGQLITFNGFLVMTLSHAETVRRRNDAQVVVQFEVENACSYSIDSNSVVFDLGDVFQLNSLDFDPHLDLWNARLTLTNDSVQIAQNYLFEKENVMEKMTLPILMGELLLIISNSSNVRTYFEKLQNEDEALIYYFYGHLYYKKGEYDLALDDFQISYELMMSDERVKDSAYVLHDIGYVYDMKKEYKQAFDSHCKALDIRQAYYSENDVEIGVSFYNIGRTLVTMDDYDQALMYHQKALKVWEQTLANDHPYIAQSLHSHGVVYFNKQDYLQASYYYKRALEIYEEVMSSDDHRILMVKNALETIEELRLRQSNT